jgi:uncharacterized membrane protein
VGTVAHYVEVNVPAAKAYAWWRGLTNLPSVMPDVRSVEATGPGQTRWNVSGPLGSIVSWDARIVEDVPNVRIAWATDPRGDNDVTTSGAVRFDDHGSTTGVEVSLAFDPPAGMVGEAVAKLLADPQDKVERALEAFKETIEQGATSGA